MSDTIAAPGIQPRSKGMRRWIAAGALAAGVASAAAVGVRIWGRAAEPGADAAPAGRTGSGLAASAPAATAVPAASDAGFAAGADAGALAGAAHVASDPPSGAGHAAAGALSGSRSDHRPDRAPRRETGYVVIGGPGALRGEIRVDGRPRGFAPRLFELATGKHRIEVVTPSGRRIGPRTMTVSARNTASEPLRWLVPGGS
jgi:hypothetical protein